MAIFETHLRHPYASVSPMNLFELDTPALILERGRLDQNIERMATALRRHGVPLRPHVKTAKSYPVISRALRGQPGGVTVSTVAESEACQAAGVRDILYAVGLAPQKVPRLAALARTGARNTVILDSPEVAATLRTDCERLGVEIGALIELDVDGHRAGVRTDAPALLQIGHALGPLLRGVMTHAGESYNARSTNQIAEIAEQERAGAVRAAEALRAAGLRCDVVSVGSTPTALLAERLNGVTEVRAGVHMFFDLVMAGLGVCALDEIALSVLTTVIGHQREKGWLLTDSGWTALSRDRGTSTQAVDRGYGLVCDIDGAPIGDLIVSGANQEHGIISSPSGAPILFGDFPVGGRLRILPIHACATATQHAAYQVVDGARDLLEVWPRFGGW